MIKKTHHTGSTGPNVHNIYLHQDGNLEVISPSSIHTPREYYLSPPHLWGGAEKEGETRREQRTVNVKVETFVGTVGT